MHTCPECDGHVTDEGDYLECEDCGVTFTADSTHDDYEVVEPDDVDDDDIADYGLD